MVEISSDRRRRRRRRIESSGGIPRYRLSRTPCGHAVVSTLPRSRRYGNRYGTLRGRAMRVNGRACDAEVGLADGASARVRAGHPRSGLFFFFLLLPTRAASYFLLLLLLLLLVVLVVLFLRRGSGSGPTAVLLRFKGGGRVLRRHVAALLYRGAGRGNAAVAPVRFRERVRFRSFTVAETYARAKRVWPSLTRSSPALFFFSTHTHIRL